jgi:starch synthase
MKKFKDQFYVVHSGMQHVLQIALALDEIGALKNFYTSFYVKRKYRSLIKTKSNKINQFLTSRCINGLDENLVKNYPYYEFIEIFAKQLIGKTAFITHTLPRWRDRSFVRKIKRDITIPFKGVWSFPNNSLEIFEYSNLNDGINILEQPIGYYREAEKIFAIEKEINPSLASTITFSINSSKWKDRIDKELNYANYIMVPSNFVKNSLIINGIDKNKIKLNNYGSFISPVDSINQMKKSTITVLFVGQISQRKGIKYLFDAIKICKKNNISIKLIIIGTIYGDKNSFKDYWDLVDKYYPSLPRDRIKDIMIESDVFVLPSLFEGSALVVYEAISNGLVPIVTPNTGADFVQDGQNGYIVPIRNSEIIAQRIIELYRDFELLLYLKENAHKSSKDMTWENYRKRIQLFVQSL